MTDKLNLYAQGYMSIKEFRSYFKVSIPMRGYSDQYRQGLIDAFFDAEGGSLEILEFIDDDEKVVATYKKTSQQSKKA